MNTQTEDFTYGPIEPRPSLLEAIASFEGFGASPMNRPTRNNNPGNLIYGPHARRHGGVMEVIPPGFASKPRFAAFETPEAGWRALRALLEERYKGYTVAEMMYKYSPPFENNTDLYIEYICKRVGCSRTDVIDGLL
jgi:hypothetical protein